MDQEERNAIIEECAKVCDEHASMCHSNAQRRAPAGTLAATIRSIKQQPSQDADKRDAERLETIKAVREHIVSVVRAFCDKACADYLDNWHKAEHIDQAIREGK